MNTNHEDARDSAQDRDQDGADIAPDEPQTTDDFWNQRDEGPKAGGDRASSPPDSGDTAETPGDARGDSDPVDVDSTVVPVKRSKVVPVIFGAIFLGAIAVAGSAIWTGYQKFQPKRAAAQSTPAGGGLIDVGKTEQGEGIPAPGGKSAGGVILVQPGASATTTPSAPSGAVDPAALAASAGANAQVAESAIAAQEAQAVAQEEAREAAELAAQQAIAASKAKAAMAEPTTKVAKTGPSAKPATKPGTTRPSGAKRVAKAKAETPSRDSARGSSVASAKSQSRKGKGKGKPDPQLEASSGSLTQYKVMSIWPRQGDFQQAWVKSKASGRVHIVRAGEELDGMRVLTVDSRANLVRTDQGEVR